MSAKLAKYYPHTVIALAAGWLCWWFYGLEPDPFGAKRLLGFLAFDVVLFLWGAAGMLLWRWGMIGYVLPTLVLSLPFGLFIANCVSPPWPFLPAGIWLLLTFLCAVSALYRARD